MIYGRVRRIDASVDIDPVNNNGRLYPTDSCKSAGASGKIASGLLDTTVRDKTAGRFNDDRKQRIKLRSTETQNRESPWNNRADKMVS